MAAADSGSWRAATTEFTAALQIKDLMKTVCSKLTTYKKREEDPRNLSTYVDICILHMVHFIWDI